jgi:hypothetical protein
MLAIDGYEGSEVQLPPDLFVRGGEALSIEEAHARALRRSIAFVKKTKPWRKSPRKSRRAC